MDNPLILDKGKDIAFYCAGLEGKTTLTACEQFCQRYSGCDTVAMANDELAAYETIGKTGYGLEEIIRKANCKDYAEFVNLLYETGCLAGREAEMERIVEALDEIDSSTGN